MLVGHLGVLFGTLALAQGRPSFGNTPSEFNTTHSHNVSRVDSYHVETVHVTAGHTDADKPTGDCTCVGGSSPTPCNHRGDGYLAKISGHGSASHEVVHHQVESLAYKKPDSQKTATFEHHGPVHTLSPAVHWDCDTKPVTNVVPVPAEDGSQMYYGVTGKLTPALNHDELGADCVWRSHEIRPLRFPDLLLQ